jgi:hypothetical protein
MLRLVLPRVAVTAATLAFSRQIIENRLNQSHRNLGPVSTWIHGHHLLSSIDRGKTRQMKVHRLLGST